MKYFNLKSVQGVETVDHLDPKEFKNFKEFKKELYRLLREYQLCGMNVYISQRACKEYYS